MKKIVSMVLCLCLLAAVFAGCAANSEIPTATTQGVVPQQTQGVDVPAEDVKIALLLPGNLGDQSFFDLTYGCVPLIKETYGIDVKVVEMGADSATWLPAFQDYGDLGYDIILSLTSADPFMQDAAKLYPDTAFINVNGTCEEGYDNLVSRTTKGNEMCFFGGVVAALKAQELGEDTLGFVGGLDVLGINYMLMGFIEGAKWVNPDIKVVPSYVGSFTDPATAKENALLLYGSDISVIFACAGGSGLGVMEAAAELGKFTIGVDIDQYEQLKETSPELAATILTSCMQNIPQTACKLVGQYLDGTLEYGTFRYVGFADDAVAIVKNENLKNNLSEESLARIEELEQQFKAGELPYTEAFFEDGSSLDEASVSAIIDAARP